jgi:hypothetical protein
MIRNSCRHRGRHAQRATDTNQIVMRESTVNKNRSGAFIPVD